MPVIRPPRKRGEANPRRPVDEWRAHALRVAVGIRHLQPHSQLALVREWSRQAFEIKQAVQRAERAVKSRLRVRASRGKADALADELLAEAAKSEAARSWLASDLRQHFREAAPIDVARAALWHAAHAAVLSDGPAAWPLTNPQHLVIGASMYDLRARSRSFSALHVSILALVALEHSHAVIARALELDTAQVRSTLRLAGAITLADLYAQ